MKKKEGTRGMLEFIGYGDHFFLPGILPVA